MATTGVFGANFMVAMRDRREAFSYVASFPPSWQEAGGGSFVDRAILRSDPQWVSELVMVTNRLSTASPPDTSTHALSSIPLQVRSSKPVLAGVAARCIAFREPYGAAKFRVYSRQWRGAGKALRECDSPLVCSSFVPLLCAYDAKAEVDTYIAFNVEWIISKLHAPRILGNDWKRHRDLELQALERVPNIWALSKTDAQVLADSLGREVQAFEWKFPTVSQKPVTNESPLVIGYLGTYSWPPNAEDMTILQDQVSPLLSEAGIRHILRFGGKGTENAPAGSRVERLGRIADATEFIRGIDVMVVPRAVTTGVSVKVIEALNLGANVITTSAVARSLGNPAGVLVADDPREIAAAVAALIDC